MTKNSYWPEDLFEVEYTSPARILVDAGNALTERSGGKLRGVVTDKSRGSNVIRLAFGVVAPAMGDYRVDLLTANHTATAFYPVTIYPSVDTGTAYSDEFGEECSDEAEFRAALHRVLKSSGVVNVIRTLMTHQRDMQG